MTSNDFDVDLFEQRLTNLKDTQEGIQQMSSWCLQQRAHHKKIVSSWLNVLKQVRVEHRLTLFHLANDVIQYSKRKNYEFVESWGTTLQKATTMVRDERVRNKIFRILKIWEQRQIYSEEYLSDLNGLLSMNPVKKTPQPTIDLSDDFQASILIANIKDCVRLEHYTDRHFRHLPKDVPNCEAEAIKHTLKERSRAVEAEKQFEEYVAALEVYIKSLKTEIKCRTALVTNIDHAETFYANQRGDVKVVVNAYKNFGNRIKIMKKKLEEIAPQLPSPIPSPDINAPSPEPDADIILPDEQNNTLCANMFKSSSNGYSSYMDRGALPFDINDFNRDSPKHTYDGSSNSTQPIEVINNRQEEKNEIRFDLGYFKPAASTNPYTNNAPLPVPPVTDYERSQSGISSYSDTYSDTAYNPIDAPYNTDSSYIPSRSNSYDGTMPLMPPPPMPPGLGGQGDEFSSWDLDMSWDVGNTSNSFNHVIETPASPPRFEQEGVNTNVIEYVDRSREPVLSSIEDVDQRQLHLPPSANVPLPISKEKGRSVDIDHRNLISLTGSPGPKLTDNASLWSSEDKDLRQNLIQAFPSMNKNINLTTIDTDYRQPYHNVKDIPLEDTPSSIPPAPVPPVTMLSGMIPPVGVPPVGVPPVGVPPVGVPPVGVPPVAVPPVTTSPVAMPPVAVPAAPMPPAPVPPLEPPNFPVLNDFLSPPNSVDPPSNAASDALETADPTPPKTAGKTANAKGNGNDNIESIDMEMSDEDQEELSNILTEEELNAFDDFIDDSPPVDDSSVPAFSTPTQAPFRPPLLKTPDFSQDPNESIWDNQPIRPNFTGNNGGASETNAVPMNLWRPPRMPMPGMGGHMPPNQPPPQFRMPGNQSFQRGGFGSPGRGFPPQMKNNFRSPLMRPPRNNSPYFKNRGRGGMGPGSNPFRNPSNPFRGNFRGGNSW